MFPTETKASFAKYFQKDKSQFCQCTVQLIYTMFEELFILVFLISYPISWQLLMDITFVYLLLVQFDTILQA